MNKILLIITREYLTRVKKKSFLVMTIIGPLLMAMVFILPIYLSSKDKVHHQVQVIDESGLMQYKKLVNTSQIKYDYPPVDINIAVRDFYHTSYTIICYIPKNIIASNRVVLYYKKQPGIITEERIKTNIENIIYQKQLEQNGIDINKIDAFKPRIDVSTELLNENGESETTSTSVSIAIGFVSGFIIYFFIFLYGVQVMRGVIEEKTNRIVEVIISSVKPFQLMLGKIIGVAMVGLTQFLLWVVLTSTFIGVAQSTVFKNMAVDNTPVVNENPMLKGANVTRTDKPANDGVVDLPVLYKDLMNRNFMVIIAVFIFYFLGGYLLYSALFAAVGASVDNETDSQQFMLPVTIPIVLSLVMGQTIIQNPESTMAFWFSVIPFTSPVVMMMRLPFGVPVFDLVLSMLMLIAGFLFTTWLAGRIYRTGILMYGKKVSYKELWKWLFYKG
jgi:ABC-2 type transport system permease protein